MSTVADCKTYANMVADLTGVDIISDFFNGNTENIAKIASNSSNLKANYGMESNKPFSNAIIPDMIADYGKDHNIDIIESHIHDPRVVGGSMEDYVKAKAGVELFKKKRGLTPTIKEEEPVEELEEEETKTRKR